MVRFVFISFLFCINIYSQGILTQKISGKVSYVTPQNVYLKFESTSGIKQGDTIYVKRDGKILPGIRIKYISSMSCAGPALKDLKFKIGDDVFALIKIKTGEKTTEKKAGSEKDSNLTKFANGTLLNKKIFKEGKKVSNLYGYFTANSFSDFTNYGNMPGIQRWNYILNLNAERIGGTQLSFSNNMNLAYLSSEWNDVKSNVFNKLRVYDFSLGYKTDGMNFWLGRHINYSIANLGPIDGLQSEKVIGNFALGAVLGSRPDFYSMGFNFKYFEYGAYLNRTDTSGSGMMQNTIALFQQTYENKTDRRFLYFQHNNNIFSDVYLFASTEIDLYKLKKDKPSGDFSLTSLYLSAQYTPVNRVSINLSYDARKSVVYYQTFRSFIDSLFDNEMRQGLRLSFYLRPLTGMFINLGGGYSYQKGDLRPSRNFNISITQSEIPLLQISVTASANKILGNYQNGAIYGLSINKYIPFNSTNIIAGFSNITYNFGRLAGNLNQKQITLQLSTRLIESLFLNLYYEGDFDGTTTYGRFLTGINFRF